MTDLTQNELAVLKAFADNEYTALEGEYDNPIIKGGEWMFTIKDYSGLSNQSFPGVVSSLVKKGFVLTDTEGDSTMTDVAIEDTWTMAMTDAGFDALQEAVAKTEKSNTREWGISFEELGVALLFETEEEAKAAQKELQMLGNVKPLTKAAVIEYAHNNRATLSYIIKKAPPSAFANWFNKTEQGQGSFHQSLYETFVKGSEGNRKALQKAFPDLFNSDDYKLDF